MSLTKETVSYFLSAHLEIPDWKELLKRDRFAFLRIFTSHHVRRIYFQNIYITSIPTGARTVPTIEEIIATGLSGLGGECHQLNYFAKLVLDFLGFQTVPIANSGDWPGKHLMVLVKMDHEGWALVDLASGNPLSEPVPLSRLPFRRRAGRFGYEFRRVSDTEYARMQVDGGLFHGKYTGDVRERLRFGFTLTPRDYSFFGPAIEFVWKDQINSPFCRHLFLFRHFEARDYPKPPEGFSELDNGGPLEGDDACQWLREDELDFILVFGYNVLIGGNSGYQISRKYGKYADMLPVISQYFPKMSTDVLKKAIHELECIDQLKPNF